MGSAKLPTDFAANGGQTMKLFAHPTGLILPCVGRRAVSHHDGIDAEGREPTVGALGGAGAFAEQTAFGEVAKKGKDGKHSFVLICEKFGFIGFDDGRLRARSRPTIDGFRCCSYGYGPFITQSGEGF